MDYTYVAVTASHGHWRIHVRNNGRPFQERDLTELNEKVEGFLKGEQKKISGHRTYKYHYQTEAFV